MITKPPIIVQQSSSVFLSRIGKLSDRLNRLLVVADDSTTKLRAEEVSTTFDDDVYCVEESAEGTHCHVLPLSGLYNFDFICQKLSYTVITTIYCSKCE